MEFEKVIRERSAVRKFSDRMVSDDVLNKILEAAVLAPTAKNNQPFRIFVIKVSLDKVDMVTTCRYGAPLCLLICGDKIQAYTDGNYSSFEMDASIVCTHMMLEATNLGVDNIWIRRFNVEDAVKVFDLPSNLVPVCFLDLGYKADDCPVNPLHNVRKSIDELVSFM